MSEAGDWAELFSRLSVPRLPGSAALADVEALVAARLTDMGYVVSRTRFSASDRSLVAASVGGAGLGWISLLISPFLVLDVAGWAVTATGLGAIALVGLLVFGFHQGELRVGVTEVTAENISAVRGEEPRLWLVAHSDSKAQAFSLASRVVAVMGLSVGSILIVVALCLRPFILLPWWLVVPGATAAVLGGAALSRATATNESPGAVDNATGIVAALYAAQQLAARSDVGVLITGAEEYGMTGARVWAASGDRNCAFVNFDGIDSRGDPRISAHVPGRRRRSAGVSRELALAVGARLAARGHRVIRNSLPPGVLVDGVALAKAGMSGVTLSRGDWQTLSVVHSARDSAERVNVAAALEFGRAAAGAVMDVLG